MKPLVLDDLVDLERFRELRSALRDAVIAHKRPRRVAVGDRISVVFEDRETLRWQVLEMARVERIRDPRQLQQELDVYNELLPGPGELAATLFVEITRQEDIKPALDRLVGLDRHVALVLGEGPDAEAVPAAFDARQAEEGRISAVQYLRFAPSPAQQRRLRDLAVPARLRVDHRLYRAEELLSPETRRALVLDLDGGRGPLVDFEAARAREPGGDEVLAEGPRARAVRLADARRPGHVVVEPREPVASLLEASPELLAELASLAQRAAREVLARHGSARISVDAAAQPLRWHVAPHGE